MLISQWGVYRYGMLNLRRAVSAPLTLCPREHVPGVVPFAELGDLLVHLRRERDLLEVALDARRLHGLGDDGVAAVGAPGNEHLRGCRAELLRDLLHDGLVGELRLADGCRTGQ